MPTVKELLLELDNLKSHEVVWLGIRDWLEGFLPEGGNVNIEMNGVHVPEDAVINVLGEIDEKCLGPIQARVRSIEAAKIDETSKTKKAKNPKPVTKRGKSKTGRVGTED